MEETTQASGLLKTEIRLWASAL